MINIIDRREAERLADKILVSLSDYYYGSGYNSEHYKNPKNGGIYEHKLATMIGVPNETMSYMGGTINVPSPLFLAATEILEADGYVKRLERVPGYPVMGLQHTEKGLKRAADLKASLLSESTSDSKDSVFIVHGRDESTKQMLAEFLEKLGLEAVILHEQPNRG